jgi:hypothetical protein
MQVVILSNLGLYLRKFERCLRRRLERRWRRLRRCWRLAWANWRLALSCRGQRHRGSLARLQQSAQLLDEDDIGDADDICSVADQIPLPSVLELELAEMEDRQISPFTVCL